MTIEILETYNTLDPFTGQTIARAARISIDGLELVKGGLPVEGNLQTILNSREAELLAIAQSFNRPIDIYEHVTTKKLLKAVALVVMDELNILRAAAVPPLTARTAGQIESAIKNKLKTL